MSDFHEIEKSLWNDDVDPESYGSDRYAAHVLEQYKTCLQMADNISQRRGAANTFFLTFNTAVVGALANIYTDMPREILVALFLAAIFLCIAWILLLRSYRTLSTAKFKVIGALEKHLPASPFWSAEWKALGEGRDPRKHISLTPIETLVPIGFVSIYVYLAYVMIID